MLGWLFPSCKRDFKARRYLNIVLRTVHLFGIAGFAGLFMFDLEEALWRPYAMIALFSGLLMVVLELYVDAIWILQMRGIAVIVKLMILCLAAIEPQYLLLMFTLMIALSGYFSHAPGRVRYYVPLFKRVIPSSHELRVVLANRNRNA